MIRFVEAAENTYARADTRGARCAGIRGGSISRGPHRRVVILAEYDALLREHIRRIMHAAGWVVLPAANGTEAIEIAATYPAEIHVVVADQEMPGLSGAELAKILSRERPRMRVLLIFSQPSDELRMGHRDWQFLRKPFLPNALARAVAALTGGLAD